MGIHKYKEFSPKFDKSNFIAPGAFVIGRVNLKENASIWFNSVVRADVNSITIGKGVNIQDLSMLHVTEENALSIADFVSVGHSVILHGCTIEEGCLIGMGAKILDGAIIGKTASVKVFHDPAPRSRAASSYDGSNRLKTANMIRRPNGKVQVN